MFRDHGGRSGARTLRAPPDTGSTTQTHKWGESLLLTLADS